MLTLERLESRRLLAASVKQSGNTLTITGDNADDVILVVGGGAGEVEVFTDSDGNGLADDSLGVFSGVGNLKINSKGGDDDVGVFNVELQGNVDIKTGNGDDVAVLMNGAIQGNVTLNTGSGNDVAGTAGVFADITIGGNLKIRTGNGNDGVSLSFTQLAGDLDVNAGSGDDLVHIEEDDVALGGGIRLNGARGNDYLSGDNVTDLEQQLDQLEATLRGFEVESNFGNLPPSILDPLQARTEEALDHFGL
jgi:hypothetical protein